MIVCDEMSDIQKILAAHTENVRGMIHTLGTTFHNHIEQHLLTVSKQGFRSCGLRCKNDSI